MVTRLWRVLPPELKSMTYPVVRWLQSNGGSLTVAGLSNGVYVVKTAGKVVKIAEIIVLNIEALGFLKGL